MVMVIERNALTELQIRKRLVKVRELRASSSATRKEYVSIMKQVEELRAKAFDLKQSYRSERDEAKKLLVEMQEACDHEHRVVRHDKEKFSVLRTICPACLKDFSVEPEPVAPEPTVIPELLAAAIEQEAKKPKEPEIDPRVAVIRPMLPELLLHSWTANLPFNSFVKRAWHQFDASMDFWEFHRLVLTALKVSPFALKDKQDMTVRQFLAIYYRQVNDRMWDGATNDTCLRELRTMLGFRAKREVERRLALRDLTKKHDWKTIK